MRPIRIFVDQTDLTGDKLLVSMLYAITRLPDWTNYHEKLLKIGVFDQYVKDKKPFFELTELENCEYILFPFDEGLYIPELWVTERLQAYAEYERKTGKPVLIFYSKDPEVNRFVSNLPFTRPVIFATSIFKSAQPTFVHPQPGFIVDPLQPNEQVAIRQKQTLPIVGFCGYAAPLGVPWSKYRLQEEVRLLLDQLGLLKILKVDSFHTARVRALKNISGSKQVKANFIIRHYSAFDTDNGMFGEGREQKVQRYRQEYFDNIRQSDYTVCARGHGNFSYRLYETLALGRIPVFINTDSALPFDDTIEWKRYCVWINQDDIPRTAQIVRGFHDALSQDEFQQLQADCRKLWQEYLNPEGFYGQIARYLHAQLHQPQSVIN